MKAEKIDFAKNFVMKYEEVAFVLLLSGVKILFIEKALKCVSSFSFN